MSEPWYRDGLRFTCTQCGNCCTGEPGFVWVDDDDLSAIAAFLDEDVGVVRAVYTKLAHRGLTLREKPNGDCVFYDRQRGCTIYSVRPPQCRTWPFWESNVETPETWEHTCAICPGSGQGELIPADEITSRLKVIRL
jgi:Fe-S-cluster containining protein